MINFNPQTHTYSVDGKPRISVTQLLKKHGLAPNYDGVDEKVLERKASIGTAIHEEIENYTNKGEVRDFYSDEFGEFMHLTEESGLSFFAAEQIVQRDPLAGTIDLLGVNANSENIIADTKTSQTLDREYVRWQLSLYAWILNNIKFAHLYAIHLPVGKKGKIVELEPIPQKEVERLIEAEQKGEIYSPPPVVLDRELLAKIEEAELLIKQIEEQKSAAVEQEAKLKAALLAEMKAHGVKSFKNERLSITYVAPSERETIDSAALRKAFPGIAAQYSKKSQVKESVRITLI
ncbi:Dna2/Cas4 domain-containing protein [Candidatus Saccharibacteria bacterium]|nr:Dna2/Cas4 domain-containing protein [Candidatus Saccharibacteria bacterium]